MKRRIKSKKSRMNTKMMTITAWKHPHLTLQIDTCKCLIKIYNKIKPADLPSSSTMDEAIVHIQQNIGHMEDEIMRQKKRIELSIQQIKEYSDGISSMKSQESSIMEYLELIHKERIPEMMMQKERIKDSKMAMMNARKQNHVRKRGFEKYRQRISLENRLSEIRMQIQTVIKRDEIWLSIRDWGVLTGKYLV